MEEEKKEPVAAEVQVQVEKESEIESTFIGSVNQIVEFQDKLQNQQSRTKNEKFNDVLMQISDEKDFYRAWENAFTDTIEGYEIDETSKADATKTEWIEKLPGVLTFQMGRLKFEKGRASKQLHQFPIPKEIYPDRFMLENLDEVKALRKRVKVLRDKINFLEECLSRYTNYNGSSTSITAALEQVLHLFSN